MNEKAPLPPSEYRAPLGSARAAGATRHPTAAETGVPLSAGARQPDRHHLRLRQRQGALPADRRVLRDVRFRGEARGEVWDSWGSLVIL